MHLAVFLLIGLSISTISGLLQYSAVAQNINFNIPAGWTHTVESTLRFFGQKLGFMSFLLGIQEHYRLGPPNESAFGTRSD